MKARDWIDDINNIEALRGSSLSKMLKAGISTVYQSLPKQFHVGGRVLQQYIYLTGPHAFGPKNIYFVPKILMKQPHDCKLLANGREAKWSLLKKTERKLKSPLGAHRITKQPRRHGSSARYIRDPMTQGYRPGGACRSCGTIPRKSSRSPGPFLVVSHYTIWTTVITLQIPPVTYAPR